MMTRSFDIDLAAQERLARERAHRLRCMLPSEKEAAATTGRSRAAPSLWLTKILRRLEEARSRPNDPAPQSQPIENKRL